MPVDVGVAAEFSFQNPEGAAESRSVKILPILEKRFGKIQIDLNPAFRRPLYGPDTGHSWSFGLAARMRDEAARRFTPSLEYYSGWPRTHQILPRGDFRLAKNVVWSLGWGSGSRLPPTGSSISHDSKSHSAERPGI